MLSCLVPGNIAWAQHAPVLMISVARLNFEHNGEPNRHAFHDVGIATGFLMLQAASHRAIADDHQDSAWLDGLAVNQFSAGTGHVDGIVECRAA